MENVESLIAAISAALESLSLGDMLMTWIYESVFGAVADFFTLIATMTADLFSLSWVQGILHFFHLFGWGLFLAGLAVAVFEIAVEYQSMGHFSLKSQILPLLYGFLAVNLFTTVPIRLYAFCISAQNTLMHDLASLFASDITGGSGWVEAGQQALQLLSGMPSLLNVVVLIALGYCVIKVFFANIKRGGILLVQIAVGSLHMYSIPRGYIDGFGRWCQQVIGLCLTAFLQMTLLYLGLLTWQINIILGLGVMLAANEVPRIAAAFGLDTSAKVTANDAEHFITRAVSVAKFFVP